MSPINGAGRAAVQPLSLGGASGPRPTGPSGTLLPTPSVPIDAASGDTMAILYALTAKQRDSDTTQRGHTAERKGDERKSELREQQAEIARAKEAQEDGGWLDDVMDAIDSVCDAVVGGNPLQDLAHFASEATGIKAFDIVYDFIRPDALLHAAAMVTTAATGCDAVGQAYALRPTEAPKAGGAGLQGDVAGSSLKTRFQAAADLSGERDVMDVYAATRTVMSSAMVTVGTCGTGTVAIVAISSSAALMAEAKADVLGKLGVDDKTKMWARLAGQGVAILGTGALSFLSAADGLSTGVKAATNIISGANQTGRGAVTVGKAAYENDANDHFTEATKHEAAQGRLDREQKRLVSGLREVTASYQRTLETIAGSMKELGDTHSMLARQIA